MLDLQLPGIVSSHWIAIWFVAWLAVLHVVLVLWKPLTKRGWKQVDYVWLATAFLGILASVGSARQLVTESMYNVAAYRLDGAAESVTEWVDAGRSEGICREFVRSEHSPPPEDFERAQREYDRLCAWFRAASQHVDSVLATGESISLAQLGGSPPPTGADQWYVETLAEAVVDYNAVLASRAELADAAAPSNAESELVIMGPYLLAVALALRITKVSGELKLG